MHPNSEKLFERYARKYFLPGVRVLEIGPDKFPSTYCKLAKTFSWATLDIYPNENLTYCAKEEYSYPISDGSYDIVLAGQVLEHVRKPWIWIKELARVCQIGGYVIIINPVSWKYHEAPVDCWRVYPEGMKALYEEAGLSVILSTCECLDRRIINQVYDTITIGRKGDV
jgi:SAM-dependent methyltransferase